MNPNTPAPAHMLIVQMSPADLAEMIEAATLKGIRAGLAAAQPASPSEWVDVRTGAEVLKCHPRTLAKLAQSGAIPSSRVGNRLRLRRVDLEAYLAKGAP